MSDKEAKKKLDKLVIEREQELRQCNNYIVKAVKLAEIDGNIYHAKINLQMFTEKETGKPVLIREV